MAIDWISLNGNTGDRNLTGMRAKIGGLNYDFATDRFYWAIYTGTNTRVYSAPFDLGTSNIEAGGTATINNPLYWRTSTAGGARFLDKDGGGPAAPLRVAHAYQPSSDNIPRLAVYRLEIGSAPIPDRHDIYAVTSYGPLPSFQVQPRGFPGDAAQLMFIWAGPQEKVHGTNYDRLWFGDWSGDTLSSEQLIPNLGQSGAQLSFTLYGDSSITAFDVDNLLPAHRNLAFDYKRSDLAAGTTRRFTRVLDTFTDLGQSANDRNSSTAYMTVIGPESSGPAYHAFVNSADTVKIVAGLNEPLPSSESVPGVLHRLATYLIADPVERTPRRTIYLKFVDGSPATTVQWKVREGDVSGAWDAAWSEDTYSIPSATSLKLTGSATPPGDAFWLPGFDWYAANGVPTGDWTDPGNAFDVTGGRANFATTATSGSNMTGAGTNAPASGGTIRQVIVRCRLGNDIDGTDYRWKILNAPSGGWNWSEVQQLRFQWTTVGINTVRLQVRDQVSVLLSTIDHTSGGTPSNFFAYGAEVAVIHDDHDGWAIATAKLNGTNLEYLFKIPLDQAGPQTIAVGVANE